MTDTASAETTETTETDSGPVTLETPETQETEQATETQETTESEDKGGDDKGGEEQITKPDFDANAQQYIQKNIINPQVGRRKEAEEKAAQLQAELDELKAQQPEAGRPEIPDLPDATDPDYETKVKERDEALIEAAKYDENERLESEKALELQQQQQKDAEKAFGS